MAKGGFKFENSEFDPEFDDYDYDDINDILPMVPNDDVQRIIVDQSDQISDLRGQLRQTDFQGQKERLVKAFYGEIR